MELKALAEEFPVAVTLRFQNQEAKSEFMSALSDGWGENYVGLEWPSGSYTQEQLETGEPFAECVVFGVEVFSGDEE